MLPTSTLHNFQSPVGSPRALEFDEEASLLDRLERAAAAGTGGVICLGGDGAETRLSYADLLDAARRIAGGLIAAGTRPGDAVLLQLEAARDFIPGFWG